MKSFMAYLKQTYMMPLQITFAINQPSGPFARLLFLKRKRRPVLPWHFFSRYWLVEKKLRPLLPVRPMNPPGPCFFRFALRKKEMTTR